MAIPETGSLVSPDAIAVVLKIVQRAKEPVTIDNIQKELPGPFKIDVSSLTAVLDEQVQGGQVYEWMAKRPHRRFWNCDPESYAREKLLEILSHQALTLREMEDALQRRMFGCSKTKVGEFRKRLLNSFVKDGLVLKHPLQPRKRAYRYGVKPPDPEPYLGKAAKEFETIYNNKLKKVRISLEAALEAFRGLLLPDAETHVTVVKEEAPDQAPPSPPPTPSQDFQKLILDKIIEIEPGARQQNLVSIRNLRAAIGWAKDVFDETILGLAGEGKIFLHRHVYPWEMTDEEREQMVKDGQGNYYMGLVLRS